MKGRRGKEV